MKISAKKSLAALALITAMSAGTAQAMNSVSMQINSVVGVSSTNLRVHIEDGVAHLFGTVESGVEAAIAEAHVKKLDGVNEVFNNILLN